MLLLNEASKVSRGNLIDLLQIDVTGSSERNAALEQRIAANTVRRDELLKSYEDRGLIADDEDRRLFQEVQRAKEIMTASRTRAIELAREGKADESRQLQQEAVIPDYEKYLKAIDLTVDYKAKLGQSTADAGKASALFSVRLIGARPRPRLASGDSFWHGRLSARPTAPSTTSRSTLTGARSRPPRRLGRYRWRARPSLPALVNKRPRSRKRARRSKQMSSMIRATAENAEKAKELAAEARSVAATGSMTMAEMTHAMAAIDSSSAEVAKIVKNIDEIAFQTNILALNAAVEAARAGEAGAGFAVVADEVRSLAQRSAAAAKETADKIEAAIANSRKGSQCTAKVEESLTQIADKVNSTDSLVSEIATAAREQAQGIEQINVAIAQMDKVSQSNSASAEESASAAEELDAQAETLKDLVAKLRLLVDGKAATLSPAPVSSQRLLPKMTPAITGRRTIPMPGDPLVKDGSDDSNFRNF